MEIDWKREVKGILKAEMARKGFTQDDLVEKLNEIGVEETKAGIANKVSRGTFSAIFLLQCLKALGCNELRIDI